MADDQPAIHAIPASSISLLVAVVSLAFGALSLYQSVPTTRELEDIKASVARLHTDALSDTAAWQRSVKAHEKIVGHAGVVAQVATAAAEIAGVKGILADEHARVERLAAEVRLLEQHQYDDQGRSSRLDESMRHVDLSVPPLSERLATVEANLKAFSARLDVLVQLERGAPSIQTDKGQR